jgi:hypothetical protein
MIRSRHLLCILLPLLLLLAVVQVLPQVDLPDTAFHENEAPLVAKFRLVKPPALAPAPAAIPAFRAAWQQEPILELALSVHGTGLTISPPVLLFSLRC